MAVGNSLYALGTNQWVWAQEIISKRSFHSKMPWDLPLKDGKSKLIEISETFHSFGLIQAGEMVNYVVLNNNH